MLGKFLSEFLSRIIEIDENDINNFENYLEVLGYKLNVEKTDDGYCESNRYSLAPYIEGIIERQNDVSYLTLMLRTNYSELAPYYEDAISTYGNSEFKSCIEACRRLIEKLFNKLDIEGNEFGKGVLKATNETVPIPSKNTPKLTSKGIFEYWISEKKGFNRYRLIITMYSLLSGLGTYGEEIPNKEDALLCLRISEDILLWYFQKQ